MRRARKGVLLALCMAVMCAALLVAECSDSGGGGGDDDTQDVKQQEQQGQQGQQDQQDQQETFDSPDIFIPLNGVKSTTAIRLDILSNGNGVNFPLSSLETARAFEAHKTVIRYMNNPPVTQSELLEYANATNLWSSLQTIIPIVGTPALHSLTNRTIDFSSLAPGDWVLWIQTNGTAKSDISYTVYVDGAAVAGQGQQQQEQQQQPEQQQTQSEQQLPQPEPSHQEEQGHDPSTEQG